MAYSYVFPNSESVHLHEKREQATKTALRQNISLWIEGIVQKSCFLVSTEHSETLGITKQLKISVNTIFFQTSFIPMVKALAKNQIMELCIGIKMLTKHYISKH